MPAIGDNLKTFKNTTQLHTPCIVGGKFYGRHNFSAIPESLQRLQTVLIGNENVTAPEECLYLADGIALRAMVSLLSRWVIGACYITTTMGMRLDYVDVRKFEALTCDPWWIKTLISSGTATVETIDTSMKGLAEAVTVAMRRHGVDWSYVNASTAIGFASHAAICTHFNWPWLILPIALLLLTTLSLAVMLIKTLTDQHQTPLWGSSILPALFLGGFVVEHDRNTAANVPTNIKDIRKEAGKTFVSLRHTDSGWELTRTGCDDDNGFELRRRKSGNSDVVSLLQRQPDAARSRDQVSLLDPIRPASPIVLPDQR